MAGTFAAAAGSTVDGAIPCDRIFRVTLFRRVLIAMLVLALPFQGALASSRWACAAMADATAAAAAADFRMPPSAHSHAHVGAHAASPHAHHAAEAALPDASSAGGNDAGTCKLCAACSFSAATPPAPIVLGAIEPASERFPAMAVTVPRVAADGLERPPRTR